MLLNITGDIHVKLDHHPSFKMDGSGPVGIYNKHVYLVFGNCSPARSNKLAQYTCIVRQNFIKLFKMQWHVQVNKGMCMLKVNI